MKFYGSLLSLCVLQATSAFTVQAPNNAFSTALNSERYGNSAIRDTPVRDNFRESDMGAMRGQGQRRSTEDAWETLSPITVQGGSLRTCSFNEGVERVTVLMATEGRPLMSNVELWQGPDNTPQKMAVYLEDGNVRPFRCTVETPGSSNAISIRNTAEMEYPLSAGIEADMEAIGPAKTVDPGTARIVQGGAVYTLPFAPNVASVQVMLKTDGRPLNARVELLQGPNNNKQVMDIYTEDGDERPFYAVIETPGVGNVVRIVNTATVEFPLTAFVEPYLIRNDSVESRREEGAGMTWS